ncbi:MAG TPA: aminomethyltransferase beta-barrel domain-containing protein, partial [Steroidobacteraceae bacterium]
WFVARKDAARNALVVVQGHDHPLLLSAALSTAPMHWLRAICPEPLPCTVKVRYRQADQPAALEPRADGTARISFQKPQRAVTPGQYAVVYQGDRCLGGGVIETVEPVMVRHAAATYQTISDGLARH